MVYIYKYAPESFLHSDETKQKSFLVNTAQFQYNSNYIENFADRKVFSLVLHNIIKERER